MGISKDVWVRIIVFILAWINTGLAKLGYALPYIGEEFIAIVIAAVVSVWTGWKDNDITKKAIEKKARLKKLEKGEVE